MIATVAYAIGTYEGTIDVNCTDDEDNDVVIARARKQIFARAGGPPLGLSSETFRVTVRRLTHDPSALREVERQPDGLGCHHEARIDYQSGKLAVLRRTIMRRGAKEARVKDGNTFMRIPNERLDLDREAAVRRALTRARTEHDHHAKEADRLAKAIAAYEANLATATATDDDDE